MSHSLFVIHFIKKKMLKVFERNVEKFMKNCFRMHRDGFFLWRDCLIAHAWDCLHHGKRQINFSLRLNAVLHIFHYAYYARLFVS